MLRMCRPIFGTGEAVVLDNDVCVDEVIIQIEDKGVYEGYLIKKRHGWPKGVPGDLIDTQCQYK